MNWTIRAIRNRLSHQVATEFRNAVQAHEPKSTVATAHHHLGFRGNDPKRTIGDLLTARPQARFVANFILRAVISFLNLMLNWISQLPTPFALTLSVAANHHGGAIVHNSSQILLCSHGHTRNGGTDEPCVHKYFFEKKLLPEPPCSSRRCVWKNFPSLPSHLPPRSPRRFKCRTRSTKLDAIYVVQYSMSGLLT